MVFRTKGVAIRRSRCEGVARGNPKGSLALLGTRLRRFAPRNDNLFNTFALNIPEAVSEDKIRPDQRNPCGQARLQSQGTNIFSL